RADESDRSRQALLECRMRERPEQGEVRKSARPLRQLFEPCLILRRGTWRNQRNHREGPARERFSQLGIEKGTLLLRQAPRPDKRGRRRQFRIRRELFGEV